MRHIWTALGLVSLGIGLVGIVLPILPTTVFLLLAAYCFARGSERLHTWLIEHKRFGPPIEDWRREGAISRRAKRAAVIAIIAAFLVSVFAGFSAGVLAIQAVILAAVTWFIVTRPAPSGDR
ncbi:MAG: YbaN family protein [Pseudomonadota bacterium]